MNIKQLKTMVNQESTPRVAVCLAAYNGMAYVVEQIESILQQKNVNVQIFISVDQSIDGTEDLLADWALSEPRLTILSFGQHFGGAGPNFYRLMRDVNLSHFDYLSFSDQDDLWHQDKLWRAARLMINHNAMGYSSNFTAFWPSGESILVNKAWPLRNWDYLFESAGPGCTYVLHINLAIKFQQLVREADESLLRVDYHDWLTYAFARAHNYPWIIDSWPSINYRQHSNNQIGVNAGSRSFFLRVRKVLNGYGFEQSLLIADLINVSSLPVVKHGLRGGRLGYLWLAFKASQCRRKRTDQIWFFISCLMLAILKPEL
jgi:rhamnosyltransferase